MDYHSISKHRLNPHAPSVDPDTWPCGHDKTDENTKVRSGRERCAICVKASDDRCNNGKRNKHRLSFERTPLDLAWK